MAGVGVAWAFTVVQLGLARAQGLYKTGEIGMHALIDRAYSADRQVKILYAGINSFDGSQTYVWYVIAEVRAAARADGTGLSAKGCDAPGSYFLETKGGWVHIPEGAMPGFVGFWMGVLNLAGPGQSEPSTPWAPDQPRRFCGDMGNQ